MSEKELTREITEPEELQAEEETELESLLRQSKAENANLRAEICSFEENEKILTQNIMSLTAEVTRLQSLGQKDHAEIRHLKQNMNKLKWQRDEAVCDKEAQVAFLTTKMEAEIKTRETKLHNLRGKEEFLLDQNSHVVAMLTQVESHRDKLKKMALEFRKTIHDLKCQLEEAEYRNMKTEDEIKKLNRIIADKQYQIDDLNKDREIRRQKIQHFKDQLSLLQKKKILADSEEMMNPAAEPPPNGGSNSSKCLLVGLGVAVGGLLIYSAFRAS